MNGNHLSTQNPRGVKPGEPLRRDAPEIVPSGMNIGAFGVVLLCGRPCSGALCGALLLRLAYLPRFHAEREEGLLTCRSRAQGKLRSEEIGMPARAQ